MTPLEGRQKAERFAQIVFADGPTFHIDVDALQRIAGRHPDGQGWNKVVDAARKVNDAAVEAVAQAHTGLRESRPDDVPDPYEAIGPPMRGFLAALEGAQGTQEEKMSITVNSPVTEKMFRLARMKREDILNL